MKLNETLPPLYPARRHGLWSHLPPHGCRFLWQALFFGRVEKKIVHHPRRRIHAGHQRGGRKDWISEHLCAGELQDVAGSPLPLYRPLEPATFCRSLPNERQARMGGRPRSRQVEIHPGGILPLLAQRQEGRRRYGSGTVAGTYTRILCTRR